MHGYVEKGFSAKGNYLRDKHPIKLDVIVGISERVSSSGLDNAEITLFHQ